MKKFPLFRIASVLTIIFPILLPSTLLCDIALSVIALLFIVRSYEQKEWSWCKEHWVRILTLLWLYMIVRGLLCPHPKEALARALPFVRYIVFAAALARWTLVDETTRKRFLNMLIAVVIFIAADGLLQYVANYDLIGLVLLPVLYALGKLPDYMTGHDAFLHRIIHDPNNGHIRLTGIFDRPILGIMLAWLAFPAMLPLIFSKEKTFLHNRHTLWVLAAVAVVFAAIALSGERMALLLTLFGCVLAAFLLKIRPRLLLAGAVGIVVLLGALAFAAPDMFVRQVASTEATLAHWDQSPYGLLLNSDLTLASQQPVTGIGAGQFRERCETLYAGDDARIKNMCNTHPHNIYFEWLIEEGLIGFGLFLALVAVIYRDCFHALAFLRGNAAFAGFIIAFSVRVWPFMSTTNFFSRWGAPPFWLVLGALLVYTAEKGKQNAGASLTVKDSGF